MNANSYLVAFAMVFGMVPTTSAMTHSFVQINYPNALCTYLEGVNNSGEVVGRRLGPPATADGYNGFLYRGANFIPIDFPTAFSSGARGINDAGKIVGFYQTAAGKVHGFLYANGSFTPINVPGASMTFAEGINASGKIVGFSDRYGFILDGGLFTPIESPNGFAVEPSEINDSDAVVGSYGDVDGFHGFIYTAGVFSTIDVPGAWTDTYGTYSLAFGINNSGVIVGGYYEGEWNHRGFLYEDGVFTSFDVPGASYTLATGINDLGDVVGYYLDGRGACHGFLMNTIPVSIDVKPGTYTNSVNLRSNGVIPVAIISSPLFDAQEVNPATVALAGSRVGTRGKSGKYSCSTQEVNGDALPDLLCHVATSGLISEPGDTTVVLRAQTYGGQLVRGEDLIRIVPH